MAAKTPDSSERVVVGNKNLSILRFGTTNIDNGDTVDLSPYCSVVDAVWFNLTATAQTSVPVIALSGTGNITATFTTTDANAEGYLFVLGTP